MTATENYYRYLTKETVKVVDGKIYVNLKKEPVTLLSKNWDEIVIQPVGIPLKPEFRTIYNDKENFVENGIRITNKTCKRIAKPNGESMKAFAELKNFIKNKISNGRKLIFIGSPILAEMFPGEVYVPFQSSRNYNDNNRKYRADNLWTVVI